MKTNISQEIITEAQSLLALGMSQRKHDIFVEWAPHIESVKVFVYRNGWTDENSVSFQAQVYVDGTLAHNPLEALCKMNETVEQLLAKWDVEDAAKESANAQLVTA